MPYKRKLDIEKGRLLARHSLHENLVRDMLNLGCHCNCCPGLRRSLFPDPFILAKLNVRRRKLDWLLKHRPKLMRRLGDEKRAWCERTGLGDDGWWQGIVQKFGT